MRDFYTVHPEDLPVSMRALQKLLRERTAFIKAELLDTGHYVFLTRKDGKVIRLAGMMPMTTSGIANLMAIDKLATAEMLKNIEIKHPETVEATSETAQQLLRKCGKIVIKPVDGAHGNGITTDIINSAMIEEALELAQKFSKDGIILAQEQLDLNKPEVRVIVIGGKFVCAFNRIPAQITGDGIHSVKELIKIENKTIRTKAYTSDLALIDEEYSENYLRLTGVGEKVPAKGEKVQVVKMCNIGRGGTVEDVTDEFSDDLKREAEKIAEYFELPVVGIDYLGDYVLEVNSNPMLYYPAKSRSEIGVEKLLDYLEMI